MLWEIGATAQGFVFIPPDMRKFQVLADENSFDFGELKHKGDIQGRGVSEILTATVRLDKFLNLVLAKKVKARLGMLEFELTADQLECLRDLMCRLPEGETGDREGNIKVQRLTIEEDPTIPANQKSKASK